MTSENKKACLKGQTYMSILSQSRKIFANLVLNIHQGFASKSKMMIKIFVPLR